MPSPPETEEKYRGKKTVNNDTITQILFLLILLFLSGIPIMILILIFNTVEDFETHVRLYGLLNALLGGPDTPSSEEQHSHLITWTEEKK